MSLLSKLNDKSFFRKGVGLYIRAIIRDYRNEYSYSFGSGNRIVKNGGVMFRCKKQISGNGNIIELDEGVICRRVVFHIDGNNNVVRIHKNAYLSGCEIWIEDNGCKFELGQNVILGHHGHFAVTENGSEITIDDNSATAAYVQMRTGDSHSIHDEKGNRVNKAGSIHIGKHCWIGQGARILKRVSLGDNVIVGTGSVVMASFGPDVTLMGYPAFPVNFATVHHGADRNE